MSPNIIGKPTTVQARAKSYDDGIALKDSLIKSSIASDASLLSIVDERSPEAQLEGIQAEYPFAVSLNVVFTNELVKNESPQNTQGAK